MVEITKEEISKGYDAIADRIHHNLDDKFYDRVISMEGHFQGKILDIGCGGGILLGKIGIVSDKETKFFGIDISLKLSQIAKENNPHAEIIKGDAENLPYTDNTFDIVLMTEALEHMLDYKKAILEARRVLKPKGIFIVTVPNRDWLQYDFYKPFIDRHEYQPVQDHYFRFKEITDLLNNNGFKILKYKGSDNLFYYGDIHTLEQVVAFFLPFLYKRMKRLIFKCLNEKSN